MKKLFSIVLLGVFLATSLFAQLEENNDAKKLFNEGNKARKAGDYATAVKKFEEAEALVQDYRLSYFKGISLKGQHKNDEALAAFQKAAELNEGYAPIYNALGNIYLANRDYNNAITSFTKFKELADKDKHKKIADKKLSSCYTSLGVEAKQDHARVKAIGYFQEAVKLAHNDAAYLHLSEVLIEQGEYDKAIEAADNAINHRKSIPKGAPYFYKGLAFNQKKNNAKAIENFEEAMKDSRYKKNSLHYLHQLNPSKYPNK